MTITVSFFRFTFIMGFFRSLFAKLFGCGSSDKNVPDSQDDTTVAVDTGDRFPERSQFTTYSAGPSTGLTFQYVIADTNEQTGDLVYSLVNVAQVRILDVNDNNREIFNFKLGDPFPSSQADKFFNSKLTVLVTLSFMNTIGIRGEFAAMHTVRLDTKFPPFSGSSAKSAAVSFGIAQKQVIFKDLQIQSEE